MMTMFELELELGLVGVVWYSPSLGWIGLDWIGLDWIGLVWIGLVWFVGLVAFALALALVLSYVYTKYQSSLYKGVLSCLSHAISKAVVNILIHP